MDMRIIMVLQAFAAQKNSVCLLLLLLLSSSYIHSWERERVGGNRTSSFWECTVV